MTLRASLLREFVNPNLSAGRRAKLCCDLARDFENRGEYEEARELLSGLWPRLGERPDLEGLDRSTAAEVLLRVGALTGVIGTSNQIKDAQQTARDPVAKRQKEDSRSADRTGSELLAHGRIRHRLRSSKTRARTFDERDRVKG
jgi:hypothetical protein